MSPVAESWNAKGGLEVRRGRVSRDPNPEIPPEGARFVGDPGVGQYYVGWSEGPSIAGMNNGTPSYGRLYTNNPPDLGVYRTYGGDGGVQASDLDVSINAGCIASHTFHAENGGFTMAQVASGAADSQIDADAAICDARAPWPIWLCLLHEPENNVLTSTTQATYRAATRRYVQRFRAAGVTNVAWQPCYQDPWTFLSASGRDWRVWHPDWDPTTGWNDDVTMDLMGLDMYNPIPPNAGVTTGLNRSFQSMLDAVKTKVEVAGIPTWCYTLDEFGMNNMADPLPNWLDWATAARTYAVANRVVAFIYWDHSADIGRYSFGPVRNGGDPSYSFDPSGIKRQGWDHIVAGATNWDQNL